MLGFLNIAAGVGDGVDNDPDAVAVAVSCDCLSTESVWVFGWVRSSLGSSVF